MAAPATSTTEIIMTHLTANEQIVLQAFDLYDDVASTVSDLGVSWTDVKSIAEYTKLSQATVKGILGSLTKKSLVQSDDNGHNIACCLTEDGARAAHEMLEASLVHPQASATIGSEIAAALGATAAEAPTPVATTGKVTCAEIRAAALGWIATRKEFIDTMVGKGANKATVTTQWQRARGKH